MAGSIEKCMIVLRFFEAINSINEKAKVDYSPYAEHKTRWQRIVDQLFAARHFCCGFQVRFTRIYPVDTKNAEQGAKENDYRFGFHIRCT